MSWAIRKQIVLWRSRGLSCVYLIAAYIGYDFVCSLHGVEYPLFVLDWSLFVLP